MTNLNGDDDDGDDDDINYDDDDGDGDDIYDDDTFMKNAAIALFSFQNLHIYHFGHFNNNLAISARKAAKS